MHHLTHIQEQRLVIVIDSSAKQISAHSIWLGQFYKLPLIDLHLQSSCSCKRTTGNRIIGIKNICDARNALLNYLRVPCGQQFERHCAQLYTKQIWRQMPPTRCSLSLSHSLRQWLAAARTLPNTAPNTSVTLPKLRRFVRPTSQRSQLSWRWALGRNSLRQRLVRNGRAANGREATWRAN